MEGVTGAARKELFPGDPTDGATGLIYVSRDRPGERGRVDITLVLTAVQGGHISLATTFPASARYTCCPAFCRDPLLCLAFAYFTAPNAEIGIYC